MSDFRKLAHLVEQLGDKRFQALISSNNTGKVKAFCDELIKSANLFALPIEMIVGDRTYVILSYLEEGEEAVKGDIIVKRAKKLNAHLGKDDMEYLLAHQKEIPAAVRLLKVTIIFTNDKRPGDLGRASYIEWNGIRWTKDRIELNQDLNGFGRILRRIK